MTNFNGSVQCIAYCENKPELLQIAMNTLSNKYIKYAQKHGVLYAVKYKNGTLKYMKKWLWMLRFASKYYDGNINNFSPAEFVNENALLTECKIQMFIHMIATYFLKFWKLGQIMKIEEKVYRQQANCLVCSLDEVELCTVSPENLSKKLQKYMHKHGVVYAMKYKNGKIRFMKKLKWIFRSSVVYYGGNVNNFTAKELKLNEPAVSVIKVRMFAFLGVWKSKLRVGLTLIGSICVLWFVAWVLFLAVCHVAYEIF